MALRLYWWELKVSAGYRGPRGALHEHFEHMRRFRNRIMHHEPIHHRSLEADRSRIYELLGYLSGTMASQLEKNDELLTILSRRPRPAAR